VHKILNTLRVPPRGFPSLHSEQWLLFSKTVRSYGPISGLSPGEAIAGLNSGRVIHARSEETSSTRSCARRRAYVRRIAESRRHAPTDSVSSGFVPSSDHQGCVVASVVQTPERNVWGSTRYHLSESCSDEKQTGRRGQELRIFQGFNGARDN
jgi:hypothetical protein